MPNERVDTSLLILIFVVGLIWLIINELVGEKPIIEPLVKRLINRVWKGEKEQ